MTNPTIHEKKAFALAPTPSFLILLSIIVLSIVSIFGFIHSTTTLDHSTDSTNTGTYALMAISIIVFIFSIILTTGFTVIEPGHTNVIQFFGKYVGTVRKEGFIFTYPLTNRKKISVRVHNFETHELKINDFDGNPVTTAAIIVWQVSDTARAEFAVENYDDFIHTQAESALRHVISAHPYDEGDRTNVVTLRGSADTVSQELADEVAERVSSAGITVVEARISSLAYASEIAQAMLQRQQANAVVSARGRIVEGAVSMVEDALQRLEQHDIVILDDERRAAMVSNLLVVLCSDNQVSPVVNTGTLYN